MGYKEEKKGDDVYLIPEDEHTHTLIWLHGLGDTAMGFHDVFTDTKNSFVPETTKVVLLTAPNRAVTINMGMEMPAWFDYLKLSIKGIHDCVEFEHVQESKERVNAVIEEEVEALDGDYKKILIGGFSQGAALSLYTALEHPKELGGVVSFSGHQLYNKVKDVNEEKKTLPIFAYHGEMDPTLIFFLAFPFYQQLKEADFNIQCDSESALGHSLSLKELELAKSFISAIL
ncbi:unnamed protein product [Moneuplotes crassus]|uniref:Phospholipase/carboxylesterase/thioesterase domain-containing protein n=1 Tax=Euplotes crassus TaxID=5936 RepID=A0AAD2D5Q0_EUPCR|nr:unnamed protein product [Moneuplotes crassus]